MTMKNQNITVYAGDAKQISVTVYDEDKGKNMILTGTKAKWTLTMGTGARTVAEKTTDNGGVYFEDAENGKLVITVVDQDTAELNVGTYRHTLKITDEAGRTSTVLEGEVKIVK